ncbi:hypothetical protein ACWD4B_16500 [Streptomyces sp. NPDC002536]
MQTTQNHSGGSPDHADRCDDGAHVDDGGVGIDIVLRIARNTLDPVRAVKPSCHFVPPLLPPQR